MFVNREMPMAEAWYAARIGSIKPVGCSSLQLANKAFRTPEL
jgi:hypothetical protein